MVIDTGAELTLLSSATVKLLLLARSRLTASSLVGVGGVVTNADVYADLQLGTDIFQRRFVVADVPHIAGLIGGDLLSNYDVEFDLPDGKVRLWRPSTCGSNDLPWTGPRFALPVDVTWGHRLILSVRLDGTPVKALLDSGSAINLLQNGAARRMGMSDDWTDPVVYVRGIDGGMTSARLHTFSSLDIGASLITAPQVGTGNAQVVNPEMILGQDFLRSRRLWVSYRTGTVFVQ
jgi:hypothetical protein